MKKVLKWIGIVLGGLIGLVVLVVLGMGLAGGARMKKTYEIQPEAIDIPTDADALARGEHLVNVACKSCHGENLGGQVLLDDPAVGRIYAANLTPGRGGIGTHSDGDLVRAVRHGVDHDGRQLVVMPADVFINLSSEDLGAIILYIRTLPPVDREIPEPELTLMGRVLLAAGALGQPFPAEYIDHSQPFPAMPPIGVNIEYGEYLARFCVGCHGPELAGGQPPDPESPPAPNLTPGGELADWSEADFIQTIRTGASPHGHKLDPDFMPWESFSKFHDDELKALWLYLSSLPPVETVAE
jgi:mono/diheme cytochrome c family protein